MRNTIKTLAAVAGAAFVACSASAQTQVLFAEDFDSIPLGPNVEEGIFTGEGGQQDAVWTPDLPAGWSDTFSLPGIGTLEWQGWNIADGAWWQFTCGDQARSDSTVDAGHYSRGAQIIADGDEWDDYDANGLDPSAQGSFDAYITTPPVNLTGVTANSVVVSFVESWRDEPDQEASVEVSFDGGGTWTTVKHYSSDDQDPDFVDDVFNGFRQIPVNNPGSASSMLVRFGYYNAGNNWWWAIDDITVEGQRSGPSTYAPGHFFIDVPTFNPMPGVVISGLTANDADDYVIELAKDEDFTDVRLSATTSASSYTIPGSVPTGIYYVRAIARNSAGERVGLPGRRIVMDNPCIADTNGDGNVNTQDFLAYLNRWTAGCP